MGKYVMWVRLYGTLHIRRLLICTLFYLLSCFILNITCHTWTWEIQIFLLRMESDPLLALAEDARTFGNCHKRTPRSAPSSSEVLATMAQHFKTALERARQQIHLSNQQNRVLVNEAKTKDRLIHAEQLTSNKLLEVFLSFFPNNCHFKIFRIRKTSYWALLIRVSKSWRWKPEWSPSKAPLKRARQRERRSQPTTRMPISHNHRKGGTAYWTLLLRYRQRQSPKRNP